VRRRAGVVAGLAGLTALAASAALVVGPSAATDQAMAKTERVLVADDYFAPADLKVKPGTKVKWKWSPNNLDTHNVVLKNGPRGVRKRDFRSASGSIGIRFAKKFKKPGAYDFVCTFHKSVMKMTVKVKKR